MSVTLSQIARVVGVSQPVVSCALNDKPGVSAKKRAEIIEVAERLGYRPSDNSQARLMAARRHGRRTASGVIALMYSVVGEVPWLNDPFHREFVNGSMYEAGQRRLALYLLPLVDEELPSVVRQGGVDGIILQTYPINFKDVAFERTPSVLLAGHANDAYCLQPEDEEGTAIAARHLIDLGHRHIAYINAYGRFSVGKNRLGGYRRALQKAGLKIEDRSIAESLHSSEADGYAAMDELLGKTKRGRPWFTAVVCFNDTMAMGAIHRLNEANLQVPGDVSVTGFDDLSAALHYSPTLTSVSFPRYEMGRRAVAWICEETQRLIKADNAEDREEAKPGVGIETFPVELAVRDTTAAPRA